MLLAWDAAVGGAGSLFPVPPCSPVFVREVRGTWRYSPLCDSRRFGVNFDAACLVVVFDGGGEPPLRLLARRRTRRLASAVACGVWRDAMAASHVRGLHASALRAIGAVRWRAVTWRVYFMLFAVLMVHRQAAPFPFRESRWACSSLTRKAAHTVSHPPCMTSIRVLAPLLACRIASFPALVAFAFTNTFHVMSHVRMIRSPACECWLPYFPSGPAFCTPALRMPIRGATFDR